MKRISLIGSILVIMTVLVLSGCVSSNNDSAQANTNNESNDNDAAQNNDGNIEGDIPEVDMSEDITLVINEWRDLDEFEELFKKPIEDEFPNITIETIPIMPYKSDLEEQFAAGVVPDIIMSPDFRYLPVIDEVGLSYDMTDLIEKFDFDIDRFDQNFLDMMRAYSPDGELWGLPYMQNKAALHYNKDIFDKFGVDYPEDDMTYDEVIELAKQVTGEMSGTDYIGMVMPSADRYLFPPLGITLVDPETDEPNFTKEPAIQKILETYKEVDQLQTEGSAHGDDAYGRFISERDIAMIPMYFLGLDWTGLLEETGEGINWDIVTFPKWEEQGDVSAFADGYWLGVTDHTEHKEQAFKVIEFLLSEDEVKRKIRYPEESVYTDDAFLEKADDIRDPLLDDKNMEALYKYPAPEASEGLSPYEETAKDVLAEGMGDFLEENQDVNTFLRELQEETEKRILEKKENQ